MQQLLIEITSVPLKYEMNVEAARLEYKQDFQPSANVKTTPATLQIQSTPARLRLDTYNARRSVGFATAGDRVRDNAEIGRTSIQQYTRDTVDMGTQMARIEDGVTIADIINQKMLAQPEMYTAFLPSSGADVSWEPHSLSIEYSAGKTNYDWQIERNVLSFVPGSVEMRITQYPKVEIRYTGSPIYVPPSADPSFEAVG